MHVNYSIWGWVGASNNDPAQGLHTLKSGPEHSDAAGHLQSCFRYAMRAADVVLVRQACCTSWVRRWTRYCTTCCRASTDRRLSWRCATPAWTRRPASDCSETASPAPTPSTTRRRQPAAWVPTACRSSTPRTPPWRPPPRRPGAAPSVARPSSPRCRERSRPWPSQRGSTMGASPPLPATPRRVDFDSRTRPTSTNSRVGSCSMSACWHRPIDRPAPRHAIVMTTAQLWRKTRRNRASDLHSPIRSAQGCSPKKKWGTPETRLRQQILNNLGLHTRTHTRQKNCHSGSLVLSCDTATRIWVSVADRY